MNADHIIDIKLVAQVHAVKVAVVILYLESVSQDHAVVIILTQYTIVVELLLVELSKLVMPLVEHLDVESNQKRMEHAELALAELNQQRIIFVEIVLAE